MNILDVGVEESVRSIWANIHFLASERNIKTITITSCIQNEGKTTLSRNLSIAISKAGLSVLYIDADTRKIGTSLKKGLSDFIHGNLVLNDILVRTKVGKLTFITAGTNRTNPSKILVSSKFTQLLSFAKTNYDYIIIDTPPVTQAIDGVIIATKTDATILVIAEGVVETNVALDVKKQLENANANLIGVVINKSEKPEKNYNDENNMYLLSGSDFFKK